MGIQKLANGKYRLQMRRAGFARIDKVYNSKQEAEAAQAEAERLITKRSASDTTLAEAWASYEASGAWCDLAKNTQAAYKQRIGPALAALGEYSLAVLESNTELVRAHFDKRRKCGLANESIRLEIAALSAVIKFAVERELVPYNFIRTKVQRPKTTKRKRRVQTVEKARLTLETLTHSPSAQHARFNLLVGELGCRPGELAELQKEDIDLAASELLFKNTKTGEARKVHITKSAENLIRAQFAQSYNDSPYLFNGRKRTGEPAPYRYNNGAAVLKRNEVVEKSYHPHAMRREFISRAIESNIPLTTLKKQTGHKTTQALELYDEALSTAPAIRAVFDRMDEGRKVELLVEMAKLIGASEEEARALFQLKSGGKDPFSKKKERLERMGKDS